MVVLDGALRADLLPLPILDNLDQLRQCSEPRVTELYALEQPSASQRLHSDHGTQDGAQLLLVLVGPAEALLCEHPALEPGHRDCRQGVGDAAVELAKGKDIDRVLAIRPVLPPLPPDVEDALGPLVLDHQPAVMHDDDPVGILAHLLQAGARSELLVKEAACHHQHLLLGQPLAQERMHPQDAGQHDVAKALLEPIVDGPREVHLREHGEARAVLAGDAGGDLVAGLPAHRPRLQEDWTLAGRRLPAPGAPVDDLDRLVALAVGREELDGAELEDEEGVDLLPLLKEQRSRVDVPDLDDASHVGQLRGVVQAEFRLPQKLDVLLDEGHRFGFCRRPLLT
mmetsp:Transcript_47723/g.125954  ORF Transcript_47723/g.125954 Transcript_47723/m.125954 type:complete len:340 (-) Transcript_47723:1677-2696(-)